MLGLVHLHRISRMGKILLCKATKSYSTGSNRNINILPTYKCVHFQQQHMINVVCLAIKEHKQVLVLATIQCTNKV